jgi:glycosyltransferase involved in cell wall biosynthesis
MWLALKRQMDRLNPHLVLTYNWGAIDAVLAAQLRRRSALIHNESGFTTDEATVRKRRRVWARRVLLQRVHTTVVNSQSLRRIAVAEFGLPDEKVTLIRNGIDITRFSPGRDGELRERFGAGADTLVFGFIGRHRAEKNLEMMIRAFIAAGINDAKLVLVGDGPCRAGAEALAKRMATGGQILFTGEVDDAAAYLRAFDVFVICSVTEQTPNALLEAMACGLPAIGTRVGDIPDILDAEDPPAIVESNDVAGLSAAIRMLAKSPELRTELGSNNRNRCAERYSLDRMVAEFTALYDAALSAAAA